MTCKPLNIQPLSPSYTSFNLQPPRTPGRRSFPSVQVITRPLSIILFTIIRQCTNPRDVIYLIHPRVHDLALWREKVTFPRSQLLKVHLFYSPRERERKGGRGETLTILSKTTDSKIHYRKERFGRRKCCSTNDNHHRREIVVEATS